MNANGELHSRIQASVGRHSRSMLRLAFAYVKSTQDAEDVVQEVFLSFFRHSPVFSSAEHEKAWLLRATINRCKNHLKSAWNRSTRPLSDQVSDMAESQSALLEAVLSLDEKYRLPIHLHYYEGYAIKEIAELLSEKPATIGTHLARGRELLKTQIGGIENV